MKPQGEPLPPNNDIEGKKPESRRVTLAGMNREAYLTAIMVMA